MLQRKIADLIEEHLRSGSERILLIDDARQVGKTYIIRHVGKKLFPNRTKSLRDGLPRLRRSDFLFQKRQ